MIWIHCGEPSEIGLTRSLVSRIHQLDPDKQVLVTADEECLFALRDLQQLLLLSLLPAEAPVRARDFLDRHKPGALLWLGGHLRPVLLRGVEHSRIRATLVNGEANTLFSRRTTWMPGAVKAAVAPFSRILTRNGSTATRLSRGGVPSETIEVTGLVLEAPTPQDHDPNELSVLIEALGTRPVWLVADARLGEVDQIVTAHVAALRKTHRLLLVVVPQEASQGDLWTEKVRKAGLRVGQRADGEDPHPEQQVYVADLHDETGLWLRASPITFMGGTLTTGGTTSPLAPLLLGSAVLHGPIKSPHGERYDRLRNVGACREVRSAAELGVAIESTIPPEQAAKMALAGWDEITRNALLIDQLVKDALQLDEPV